MAEEEYSVRLPAYALTKWSSISAQLVVVSAATALIYSSDGVRGFFFIACK
jgi:hypothetical protein